MLEEVAERVALRAEEEVLAREAAVHDSHEGAHLAAI